MRGQTPGVVIGRWGEPGCAMQTSLFSKHAVCLAPPGPRQNTTGDKPKLRGRLQPTDFPRGSSVHRWPLR